MLQNAKLTQNRTQRRNLSLKLYAQGCQFSGFSARSSGF